jgi:hypothetical protein
MSARQLAHPAGWHGRKGIAEGSDESSLNGKISVQRTKMAKNLIFGDFPFSVVHMLPKY